MGHWVKLKRQGDNESMCLNLDHATRIVAAPTGSRIIFDEKLTIAVDETVEEIFKMVTEKSPN